MPDGYTHVRTGTAALNKSSFNPISILAFGAGTQGPDPLFFHKVWSANRNPNLLKLASMMHKKRTGAFLTELVKNADTPVKKSYAAGFLTHYSTDKTAHPYVSFLTDTIGAPYNIPHGHGFYECTLDSELHKCDYKTRIVKADKATPTPPDDELNQIAELFSRCMLIVYNEDIAEKLIVDSFKHILLIRKLFTSYIGFRRGIYYVAERLIFREPGYILCNLTPGHKPKRLPVKWVNPFTNEEITGGMTELLAAAEDIGGGFIDMANDYWQNKITIEEFSSAIGSESYETGLEI